MSEIGGGGEKEKVRNRAECFWRPVYEQQPGGAGLIGRDDEGRPGRSLHAICDVPVNICRTQTDRQRVACTECPARNPRQNLLPPHKLPATKSPPLVERVLENRRISSAW